MREKLEKLEDNSKKVIDIAEITKIFGISRNAVFKYIKNREFVVPISKNCKNGKFNKRRKLLFFKIDVEKWFKLNQIDNERYY